MTETESNKGAIARAVAPLLVVNALTVYGQLAYAMAHIAPAAWPLLARVALSIGFAVAIESVSLYVQWHAHDALLLKSHSTARSLRRWSFLIAAAVGAMNYSHFADKDLHPTAAAIAFGMLSLLSPWMWGLHSRRSARIQLLKERRVDDAGAEFSTARKRAFPIRSWKAYRLSIDQNITDPKDAWDAFKASIPAKPMGSIFDKKGRVRKDATMDEMLAWADARLPQVLVMDEAPDASIEPVRITSRPSTGRSGVAAWDVEKAVSMVQDGRLSQEIADVTGVGAKPLQLLRRAMRFLSDGMDVDAAAARVPCSLAHVQRIKAAMEVGA
jgi:hypothetical protein